MGHNKFKEEAKIFLGLNGTERSLLEIGLPSEREDGGRPTGEAGGRAHRGNVLDPGQRRGRAHHGGVLHLTILTKQKYTL